MDQAMLFDAPFCAPNTKQLNKTDRGSCTTRPLQSRGPKTNPLFGMEVVPISGGALRSSVAL